MNHTGILYGSNTPFSIETRYQSGRMMFSLKNQCILCIVALKLKNHPEGIWSFVVVFKINVTKLLHQFHNMSSQKLFRVMAVVSTRAWQRGWMELKPIHGSLFQDHGCPEEGGPFFLLLQTLQKDWQRLWEPQRKSQTRIQAEARVWQETASDPTGMDTQKKKFPEEPAVAAELHRKTPYWRAP